MIVAAWAKTSVRWSSIGVLLLVLTVARIVPAAQGDDPREQTARAFFAAGKYQDAIEIFAQMFAERPHPNYLFNIGRCYQNLGDPDKAISSFREYLRKSPKLGAAGRHEVDGYIHEMEQLQGKHADAERAVAELTPKEAAGGSMSGASSTAAARPTTGAAPLKSGTPVSMAARIDGRPTAADPVANQLGAWRSEGEELWKQEAHGVDEARITTIEAMLAKAHADDPRLAEYQLNLAGLYAAKHFQDRLKMNALRKKADSGDAANADDIKALDADANHAFLKAVEAYVQASRARSFGRQDEVLYRLALILEANNLESRAHEVLARLVRTMPESKFGSQVKAAAAPEARQ